MAIDDGQVAAVRKATEILSCFTPHTHVLSTRSLSRLTGYPRSTVHGICVTLADAGYLELVAGRGYALGEALVALGGQVMHRRNLTEAAEGLLGPMLVEDGTWALVGQLVGGWLVYLVRHASARHERINSRTGLRVPAHRTACGKAALAFLEPDDAKRRVIAACESERVPIPDFTALQLELARVREDGYVISADWRPGRIAVGAPIIDGSGTVAGGISIGGPVGVLDEVALRRAAARVVPAAARIGSRLGFSSGTG